MVPALDLPEIRAHIGQYLNSTDLLACVCVCQTWHHSFEPFLWHTFTVHGGHGNKVTFKGRIRSEQDDDLDKDTMEHDGDSDMDDPHEENDSPRLHHKNHRREPSFSVMARNMHLIRRLSLIETMDFDRFRIHCSRLEAIDLLLGKALPADGYERDRMWENLSFLIKNNLGLASFRVHTWQHHLPKSFLKLIAGKQSSLISTKRQPLGSFSTSSCVYRTDQTLLVLELLKNLVSFSADSDTFIPPSSFDFSSSLFPRVETLEFRHICVDVDFLLGIIQRCPALRTLRWIVDGTIPISRFCRTVPHACPKLVVLEFSSTYFTLQDQELGQVLGSITALEQFKVGRGHFGEKAFAALKGHFGTLQVLSVKYCDGFTVEMGREVLESCFGLERMELEDGIMRQVFGKAGLELGGSRHRVGMSLWGDASTDMELS